MGDNKAFDPPSWVEFVKDILVGNVWGLFQVQEGLLPLDPTIIVQGFPNDLTCCLNGLLRSVKYQIIMVAPDPLIEKLKINNIHNGSVVNWIQLCNMNYIKHVKCL